jgi:ubiquinone/menaquinone biosynthesis C-methylase UbiE
MNSSKPHWETVFAEKTDGQKSWFEEYPHTSMELISELRIGKDSSIIDVGGGDSHLVDALLKKGYSNISVLDISENAIQNAKLRLGILSSQVHWIISDILNFIPSKQYDCWHDRAVFHFITTDEDIATYLNRMVFSIKEGGNLILATFSEKGPEKCSGLPVKRYSQEKMVQLLERFFEKIKCFEEYHTTPFNTVQSFTYCGFYRKSK